MKLQFFGQIFENSKLSNVMKIHPVVAELFQADRQTNRHDEANSSVL